MISEKAFKVSLLLFRNGFSIQKYPATEKAKVKTSQIALSSQLGEGSMILPNAKMG
jgi:hypothetical protein